MIFPKSSPKLANVLRSSKLAPSILERSTTRHPRSHIRRLNPGDTVVRIEERSYAAWSVRRSGGRAPVAVPSAAFGACSTTAPRDVWACQIWAPVGNSRLETRTLLRGSEKSSALAGC
jgi:hypothetical protein